MKKVTSYVLSTSMLILSATSFTGCADYKHYADAKKEFAQTESIRMKEQTLTVTSALNTILSGFETTALQENKQSPIFTKTTQINGQVVTETVYDTSSTWAMAMIQMKRADIIKDIMPILERIYTQQQLSIDTPVTSGDVALAFVNHVPLMATVGGMYGLGVAGIKKAGDVINAEVSGGSNLGVKGNQSGITVNGPVTSLMPEGTTVPVVPEIIEEVIGGGVVEEILVEVIK